MDSNGIEQVRSSIAQWLFDFLAADICRVALCAARSFVCFLYVVNRLAGCLSRKHSWRLAVRHIMRSALDVRRGSRETQISDFFLIMAKPVCDLMPHNSLHLRQQ